jgi:hypothetical protein
VRNILVAKGVMSEEEWDSAVSEVERDQETLFRLDPDVQAALNDIRRVGETSP